MAIDWSNSGVSTGTVRQEMFGTNMLFDRDQVGAQGTFDDAMRALGIEDVRFPGGSITEWYFDINDPDATTVWAPDRQAWREVMPLTEFLTWAGEQEVGVNLVVPTGSLMAEGPAGDRQVKATARADLYRYFTDVLQGDYGAARIDTFEIGNEYWLSAGLTHVEYARIANLMAETAQSAIDDHRAREGLGDGWQEPYISIQIGQYGRYSPTPGWVQNRQLIDWLTPAAAEAIDAVVVHYYSRGSYSDLDGFGYFFDRLDDWAEDPRLSDIAFHVTEWNVNNQLSEELGLKQASALWFMFSEMMLRGVNAAHVWPIQQNNRTNLSGDEGQTDLTLAGEAFRLLSEAVVGTELIYRTEWETGAAWVYRGEGVSHVYVASRSDSSERFVLDRSDLGIEGQAWWRTTLGSTGDPDDHRAQPVLEVRADTNPWSGRLTFELDPYEVLRATFYDERFAASPGIGFPEPLVGGAAGDVIAASDLSSRLEGGGGSDTLTGGRGNDVFDAGSGDDHARGRDGRDTIDGGLGDDLIEGGADGDVLFGGGGADRLVGWSGDDRLAGGDGPDTLEGGGEDDTLFGAGGDRLDGGSGDDVYVIGPPPALDEVVAWSLPAVSGFDDGWL